MNCTFDVDEADTKVTLVLDELLPLKQSQSHHELGVVRVLYQLYVCLFLHQSLPKMERKMAIPNKANKTPTTMPMVLETDTSAT